MPEDVDVSAPRAFFHCAQLFRRAPREAPLRRGDLGLVAGIAAALAPKCPLCLAAYLSMFGISVGLAKIVPMLLPFGIVIASIAFVSLVRSRRSPVSPQPVLKD